MKTPLGRRLIQSRYFYLMILPAAVCTLLFSYGPMAGLYMAFVDFRPQLGNFWPSLFRSDFVGLQWFKFFFSGSDFLRVMRNTLVSSVLTLSLSFAVPILFAIMLNECKNALFKKIVQTVSYIPFFISWVIASNIIVTLLSSAGPVNYLLKSLGFIEESILFLQEGKYFWGVIALSNTWKDMGYKSIMYLAAISAVNPEYFEAADLDGLGRLRQIWHILLPSIMPTIVILLILSVGELFNTGFDQYFLLGNSMNREFSDVIDTYSFRYGIRNAMYSYAAAVGLFKSAAAFLLVVTVNRIAKKLDASHLF